MGADTGTHGGTAQLCVGNAIQRDEDVESVLDQLATILKSGFLDVSLTFGRVYYPYSRLLNLLVSCHRLVTQAGGRLAVLSPGPGFDQVIEETKLKTYMDIRLSRDRVGPMEAGQ